MKILVALKQVPDTETKIKLGPDGKSLDLGGREVDHQPLRRVRPGGGPAPEGIPGAEVTAVSVGGDKARAVLQGALALGVQNAVLVKCRGDRRPHGHRPDPGRPTPGARAST